jgi:hypothetical protein
MSRKLRELLQKLNYECIVKALFIITAVITIIILLLTDAGKDTIRVQTRAQVKVHIGSGEGK